MASSRQKQVDWGWILREIWGVSILCFAIFVGITNHFPLSTGWIGHWIVEVLFTFLFGNGTTFFPLFLAAASISIFFSSIKVRNALLASHFAFVSCLVGMDLLDTSTLSRSGGWVGRVVSWFLQLCFGEKGAWIVLAGVFWVALILLFSFSIKALFLKLAGSMKTADQSIKEVPFKKKASQKSWWDDLKTFLFYRTRKIPIEPIPLSKKTDKGLKAWVESFPEPDIIAEPEAAEELFLAEESQPPAPEPTDLTTWSNIQDRESGSYVLPPLELLETPKPLQTQDTKAIKLKRQENAKILEETLASFQVDAKVVNITPGPSVTRYELQPGTGVKISKIVSLNKDIALKLAVVDVRIEAPIPGKALIGIEVPNTDIQTVVIRNLIDQGEFLSHPSKLLAAMGLTITGESIFMDLAKMPHVLIAGATGSGKSVCVNSIILSILLRATPDEVKFLMIDPKKVELSLYEGIPHLIAPVVTNPQKAAATLKQWALMEMERRYEEFSKIGVKDISGYNQKAEQKIPYIVVIIDELADLMMVASQDVESTICRLAQMSRATGIHLVIATQRPSVNVVTGLIKANIPSRISFFLQSQIDSRTILDMPGAEKLLGKGDMLYSPVGSFKPKRVQGIFVNEKEIKQVVGFLKTQGTPNYLSDIINVEPLQPDKSGGDSEDELFEQAKEIVLHTKYASTSYLQRKLRIGYNRAARLMEELQEKGIVTASSGEKKPRDVV
jgi:S-DNA-T family DNA segregation ATPase FtsK/SpoIIIE